MVTVLPLVAKPLLPDPALPLEGMTSISSGSLPRLTEIVLVLAALVIAVVPVTGSNTSISDAAVPSVSVTVWAEAVASHSASQSLPLDVWISSVWSVLWLPLSVKKVSRARA